MQVMYVPDKQQLFWLGEKPEDPQFEPRAGMKMTQVLGSPLYICEDYTGFLKFDIYVLLALINTSINLSTPCSQRQLQAARKGWSWVDKVASLKKLLVYSTET